MGKPFGILHRRDMIFKAVLRCIWHGGADLGRHRDQKGRDESRRHGWFLAEAPDMKTKPRRICLLPRRSWRLSEAVAAVETNETLEEATVKARR